MRPILIALRHAPVAALLVGAALAAGLAVALPLLAAFAPAAPDPEPDARAGPRGPAGPIRPG